MYDVIGYWRLFFRTKLAAEWSWHSPPCSDEVKNAWKLYLHSPIHFYVVVLI